MSYSDNEEDHRGASSPPAPGSSVAVNNKNTAAAAISSGGGNDSDDMESAQQWASPLCDLCCDSSEPSDHLFAYFCPCFALGAAKQRADTTTILFNAFCFPVCCAGGAYSLVRIGYGIEGTAQSDFLSGCFAPLCAVRRLYTETRARPEPLWVGDYGLNSEEWHEEMGNFNDCNECVRSCFCPCFVAHEVHTRLQTHSPMPTTKWLDYCCLLPCSMYGQTRVTFGISTKECYYCEDFCCGCVFYPCGLNRAVREASRREMIMRAKAYVAGAGAAGKTRQGLRIMANARDRAMRVVGVEVEGGGGRSVSRPRSMA